MSTSRNTHVRFSFAGRRLDGQVVHTKPIGDVRGPDALLTVDVDGLEYRVAESEAERLDR